MEKLKLYVWDEGILKRHWTNSIIAAALASSKEEAIELLSDKLCDEAVEDLKKTTPQIFDKPFAFVAGE